MPTAKEIYQALEGTEYQDMIDVDKVEVCFPYIYIDMQADMKKRIAEEEGRKEEVACWQIFQERLHLLCEECILPKAERQSAARVIENGEAANA